MLRQPLGLTFSDADIATEADQHHFCGFLSGELIAGFILASTADQEFKMRQVAVDLNHQRSGIGTQLAHHAETFCQQNQVTSLSLHAREAAVPFYVRLGYQVVSDSFEEVGIPHYKMKKSIVL